MLSMKNSVGNAEPTITATPSIKIDAKLRSEILAQVEEEGMVIVHCAFSTDIDMCVRIWKTTFLIDRVSGSKSPLMNAFNITYAPVWELVEAGTTKRFTLIFSSLPKSCEVFDLIEEVPDSFGFEIFDIKRNSTDVYNVNVSDA